MFNSIYIHVPFCLKKCKYCAFYSEEKVTTNLIYQWMERILLDFQQQKSQCGTIRSIFIGGGTPSLIPPQFLNQILQTIKQEVQLTPDCEISCESNPDSLSPLFLQHLADAGVNRLSIGVQSFFSQHRQTLGREANPDQIKEKIKFSHSVGIKQINLDLIYAIPGQTLEDWKKDLRTACEMEITHLSAYALTVEEGTALASENLPIPTEQLQIEMWQAIPEITTQFGLQRYEISNYAKKNCRCRHNDEIWHGQTYLGLGPSASSFDGHIRFTQVANLKQWLSGFPAEKDILSAEKRAAEILAFGMRTKEGWNLDNFFKVTHFRAEELRGKEIEDLCQRGLVIHQNNQIFCSDAGFLLNNQVLIDLL